MTWVKTGTEFPDDLANVGISDAAYRTHHEAITWLYGVEQTDLRIPKRLVRRFAGSEVYEQAVLELLAAGLWRENGHEYEVVHHADVIRQSLAAQHKKRGRDKAAQQRARQRAANPAAVSADISDVVSADADRQTASQTSSSSQKEPGGPPVRDDLCEECGERPHQIGFKRCGPCSSASMLQGAGR